MFLVYTPKITPRLTYIFKHIFIRILQIPIDFTMTIDDFVAHNGPKLSYSKNPLGKEFFVRSHGLEVGVVGTWLALILKVAFALVGMGAYLRIFFPEFEIAPLAAGLAIAPGPKRAIGI